MKVIKVSRPNVSTASYVCSEKELDFIIEEIKLTFEEDEPGEIIKLELLEISQEAFDNIEGFHGW